MKAYIDQYDIMFKGLGNGKHSFEFTLENAFFEFFDGTECEGGTVDIAAEMEKKENSLSFVFSFSGNVNVVCDRCLEMFGLPVAFETVLYARFEENATSADAEVIILDPGEHKLNLAEYFRESIRLFLPLKRTHPENDKGESMCNNDMIEKLDQHRVSERKGTTDPRWDSLKSLRNKQ